MCVCVCVQDLHPDSLHRLRQHRDEGRPYTGRQSPVSNRPSSTLAVAAVAMVTAVLLADWFVLVDAELRQI